MASICAYICKSPIAKRSSSDCVSTSTRASSTGRPTLYFPNKRLHIASKYSSIPYNISNGLKKVCIKK